MSENYGQSLLTDRPDKTYQSGLKRFLKAPIFSSKQGEEYYDRGEVTAITEPWKGVTANSQNDTEAERKQLLLLLAWHY